MFITTPAKAIFDHDSTTRDLAEIDSGLALSSSLECFTCGQPHRARWEEISVMPELGSRHLFTITMKLPPTLDLGDTPAGNRRVFTVSSGEFTGDRLRGEVLPQAGSDLLLLRADRSNQQDVRLLLRTEDSALILMTYRGVRHASAEVDARVARGEQVPSSEYYLRTAPFFETSSEKYAWLNKIVSVGVGERQPDGVRYEVFEIL